MAEDLEAGLGKYLQESMMALDRVTDPGVGFRLFFGGVIWLPVGSTEVGFVGSEEYPSHEGTAWSIHHTPAISNILQLHL